MCGVAPGWKHDASVKRDRNLKEPSGVIYVVLLSDYCTVSLCTFLGDRVCVYWFSVTVFI